MPPIVKRFTVSVQSRFPWVFEWPGMLLFAILVLSMLLARSPWSNRMLAPNLEPFPDTFHYLRTAQNFVEGRGFQMGREDRFLAPSVPLAYSSVMLPIFLFGDDVRAFYLVNVLLSLSSVVFFWLTLRRLNSKIPLWGGAVLLVLVTHPVWYWLPELAMAENLLMLFLALGLYLFTLPVTPRTLLLLAIFPWVFYATKYAAAPTTAVFFFLFLAKIVESPDFHDFTRVRKTSRLAVFFLASAMTFLLFAIFEGFVKQQVPFQGLFFLLASWFPSLAPRLPGPEFDTSYFSFANVWQNFSLYSLSFFGRQMKFLWEQHALASLPLGIASVAGYVWSLQQKNLRTLSLGAIALFLLQILFMSTFYVADARYVVHLMFFSVLGLFFFGSWLQQFIQSRKFSPLVLVAAAVLVVLITLVGNFSALKSQLVVNLKAAETPWYYLAVKNLDTVLAPQLRNNEKILVITPMSPYLLDFYLSEPVKMLPLSTVQDYREVSNRYAVWGFSDDRLLPEHYHDALNQGYMVYVSEYGLGNEEVMHEAFDALETEFALEKVAEGCFETCNVYQVREKAE